uniref:Uncharacterized protein n=1 Tax=Rhizophagus irregularis (strain DAOM 181602 / DAOM 197198 / MUCL 43194) TaxID=747089 RepID=U9TV77_RHIID
MFEAINESPYKESLSLKVLGYLDDTTWLAENLNQLKHNLKIADNFYQLANILINKEKTIILANRHARKKLTTDSSRSITHIEIEFGSKIKVPIRYHAYQKEKTYV